MSNSFSFIQALFSIVCIFFCVNFSIDFFNGEANAVNIGVGIFAGIILTAFLFVIQFFLKRFQLRSFNTAILGLFFGYLMAKAILFTWSGMVRMDWGTPVMQASHFLVYFICSYAGIILTMRAEEEFRVSFPFLEFKVMSQKKKDILVDLSILSDPRIIDLAFSGLLDHHLIIPRFAIKELYTQAEIGDENTKIKARRSLELIKKLENIVTLDLRYTDTDFPEIRDSMAKLIRLARLMDTHIITSDINRVQQSSIEGVRIINIQMLSNALKPLAQAGESITIKIQRYGKEPLQGVGYLEDGTMVVVNGGAEFINKSIKAYVLSVKTTSSGRMIFCNASENSMEMMDNDYAVNIEDLEPQRMY